MRSFDAHKAIDGMVEGKPNLYCNVSNYFAIENISLHVNLHGVWDSQINVILQSKSLILSYMF